MTRANRALVVLIVATLGLWGCAQRPAGQGVSLERLRALEAKYSKLEDDYRSVATARDQARKKLAESEEQRLQMKQELEQQQELLAKERDDLKQQLTSRTTERDTLQTQFESFRKGVRSLLNQADTAASTTTSPVISSAKPATPGQS